MQPFELRLDDFCSWLCERELQVVGAPGTWFDDPLSQWISSLAGRLYGVDCSRYGLAVSDFQYWRVLPFWAQRLVAKMDLFRLRPLTGHDVLLLLADVERQHGSLVWV